MNNIPKISFQSEEDEKEFELLNVSNLFARIKEGLDHNPNLPHRLSFFALLIVTNGVGSHKIDLKEYPLKKGTVLKIAKGQVHAFEENPSYDGFLIVFTEEFVLNYFSKSSIEFISHLYNYHISKAAVDGISFNEPFIKHLKIELETENTYAQKNIVAVMLELYLLRLERLSQTDEPQKQNKYYPLFLEFKNLVEEKYTTTRNVKDYADMLLVSTKHLNKIVKEFTLNTAKHFVDDFVILETKRAIASTNDSLKEIAYTVGFDEVTNFTKFFKKHTSTTPKQFKTGL
ncbi:AraC family transcriptional regulator [Arenibacter algicola]|uniref:AraC family transcriptional regulator n=1 Tax=Arenibacter TaxID=178469 RepID=UPI000D76E425|nr:MULTISPECIES: helix-turn-helix transcriptional regulator [Arenibacter]MBU2905271.1 AraC family transcriptional regulator [Arenibacter algicola]PXX30675.1 AraC family transcriptional regulator [Arenibacter sp. ARW7G5Y1]